MAKIKGAQPLSESELVDEVVDRLEDFSKAQVKNVVKALKEEIADCLANGYKVSLSGLLTLTPTAKPGRKKGTKVRNPFDGTEKTLRTDEPDKFKVKAKVSSSIVNKQFPSVKSKAGQELLAQLSASKKKVAKKGGNK